MKYDVLYSFRRCPYAIRARWALLKTHHIVVLREVKLKNKPQEFLEISPKGTVPVLVTKDGIIIEESLDIMKWALDNSSSNAIFTNSDPSEILLIEKLIIQNDTKFKYHLDRYKYSFRFDQSKQEYHKEKAFNILLDLESSITFSKNENKYCLINNHESLADWSIWPFVRQFRSVNKEAFDNEQSIPLLKQWLNSYIDDPIFPKLMIKTTPWSSSQKPLLFPN